MRFPTLNTFHHTLLAHIIVELPIPSLLFIANSTHQTPSPRPNPNQARQSSLRTTYTYASSVCSKISLVYKGMANPRNAERNGRKTLTTVQGLPKKFDQKKILKVIKKKFACNGTIVNDSEMGEVIQLQGDQRKDVQEFLIDKKEGLELDAKTIKVSTFSKPSIAL
jgi:translation initiation factor 1